MSGMAGTPQLEIVIVNWNAGPQLRDCLASIGRSAGLAAGSLRVTVVDNASTDGSAEELAAGTVPVRVIRNAANRGFAAACNQGAADSPAEQLLFLNPDTRLTETTLAAAQAFLAAPAQDRTGIVGVKLVDEAGEIQPSCSRFPTPGRILGQICGLDKLLPRLFPEHFLDPAMLAATRPVDQVMGAFLMIRRRLFDTLGGFDERFFVYYDDVDLCLRAWRAGWSVMHYAGAQAFHRGCGTTDRVRDVRLFYNLRSRVLYVGKHHGAAAAAGVAAATLFVEPLSRIAWSLARGSWRDIRPMLGGMGLLIGDLPHWGPRALRKAP